VKKSELIFLTALLITFSHVMAEQPTAFESPCCLQNNQGQYNIILAQASRDNSCLTHCNEVLKLCKNLCQDKARNYDQYGDNPHKPVDQCLQDCEEDYKICAQSC
jgi:hypothetical protein